MNVSSKEPTISRETVKCSTDGYYEQYCITAHSGLIEELSFSDIIFIRDKLDEFIKEKQKEGTLVKPVKVEMPFKDKELIQLWEVWKLYLKDKFKKEYVSREEQQVLNYLFDISNKKAKIAKDIIHVSMDENRPKLYRSTNEAI